MKILTILTLIVLVGINVVLGVYLYKETMKSIQYLQAYDNAIRLIESQSRACSAARNPEFICKKKN